MGDACDGRWIVCWSSRGNSRERRFDEAWRDVVGQRVGEATDARWLEAVDEADRPRLTATLDESFAKRGLLRVEYRLKSKSGLTRRVVDAGAPQFDASGAFIGYAGAIFEIDAVNIDERLSCLLIESYAQAVWETDAGGAARKDSPSWRVYTGQTEAEYSGEGWLAAIHPDDRGVVHDKWRVAIAAGRDLDAQCRLKRKEGGWRWTNLRATPIRAEDGAILKWIGMNIDIHARKVADDALIQSERRYRMLFETLRDPFVRVAMDGRILEFNALYAQMLGHEPAELEKLSERDLTPQRWHDFEATILRDQILVRGYSDVYEKEYRRKNGEVFPIEIRAVLSRDEKGAPQSVWGIVRDISERKKAADRLRATQERFRALTTASSEVIFSMNPDWSEMRRLFGRGFLAETGSETADWVEKYLLPEERARVLGAIAVAVGNKRVFEFEHRVRRSDGSIGWTSSRAVPVFGENGEIIEWFGATKDITARKKAEEALREADRHKDEFLAVLAHELRNPLSPIYNATQILRRQMKPGDRNMALVDMVQRQLDHLLRLVDELLELTRIRRGVIHLRKESVAVDVVLRDAVDACQPLIERKGHRLTVHGGEEPLWVLGDPVRLTQILSNLLNNAVKYTPPRGLIDIDASRAGEDVVLRVRDNGAGISASVLPHVFDLFTRAEPGAGESEGGLGIGLSLARKLVDLHGGRIEARSAGPGCGSEFLVHLPAAQPPASGKSLVADNLALCVGTSPRALVIDDDHDVADSFGLLLETMGTTTRVVYDGASGVAAIRDFGPDLVFVDLGMPRMDGYETARRIRADPDGRHPVLVAVTGRGQPEDRHRSREAGFDLHLTKPAQISVIRGLVQRALVLRPEARRA